jgi:YVTN family beta-propeller protein
MSKTKFLLIFILNLITAGLILNLTLTNAFCYKNSGTYDAKWAGGLKPLTAVQVRKAGKLFVNNCAGCHAIDREGNIGPALLPETLSFVKLPMVAGFIKNGFKGTAMPAWKGKLSNKDIILIARYIKTVPAGKTPVWGMNQIDASVKTVIPPSLYPDKPIYKNRLGNIFFVVEKNISKGAFIDGDNWTIIKQIPIGFATHEIKYTHNGEFGYAIARNGVLDKIDMYNLKPVASVRTCLDARGVDPTYNGKYVLTGCYLPYQAVIISGKTLKPLKIIHVNNTVGPLGKKAGSRVAGTIYSHKYNVFAIALKDAGQVWIIKAEPPFPIIAKIKGVGKILHDAYIDKTGRYLFVTGMASGTITVIDLKTDEMAARIYVGKGAHVGPGAYWTLKNGREVAATMHIFANGMTIFEVGNPWHVLKTVKTAGPSLFERTYPGYPYIWADNVFAGKKHDEIYVISKKPPFKTVKILIPEKGPIALHPEFSCNGKYVMISEWAPKGELVIYNSRTLKKVKVIKGLVTPTGQFNVGNRSFHGCTEK